MQTKNITNISFVALLRTGLLIALLFLINPPAAANAQASSAVDLINAVNASRSSNNLAPYSIDGELMSLAQDQSEYQASIQQCTHTRADGSGPGDHGISAENIACGSNLSAVGALEQWADALHLATYLGPTTGLVGAGVATSGSGVYYTLAVRRLTGDFIYRPPARENNHPGQQDPTQPPPSGPVEVATPNSDGSITHVIQYGETLVEIANAYGISLGDLIAINKLDPKNPVYYANQTLIIRVAFTLTPDMTATFTPRPPTRTPLPTRTPRPTKTATPFHTPFPTRTDTSEPLINLPTLEDLGPTRPLMAYTFIGISALGLLVLLFTAFLPGKRK